MLETKRKQEQIEIKKGQVWWADLGEQKGSIQSGKRPVLVVQNDVGNKHSPTIVIAPISSQIHKMRLPTHIALGLDCGLTMHSFAMLEQLRTINKSELIEYKGKINCKIMVEINKACMIEFDAYEPLDVYDLINSCNIQNKRSADILTQRIIQYCSQNGIEHKLNRRDIVMV